MRRLYVGGLNHSVTEKDLRDRFGKFGAVKEIELHTRRDAEGVAFKTFCFMNIDLSDAELKKCMTVLHKSKWKGETLQIEMAKESFLHRLSEERQAAAEQQKQHPAAEDKRKKMLDSLSKAGVENFTMKAAVPGTEIPGHKDWVVSKFGRVLPVLRLRGQKGGRPHTLKYDPSKYCHNIRKLDSSNPNQPTPVGKLTWELQAGYDDISKKRRGEFPPYQPPRPEMTLAALNASGTSRRTQPADSVHGTKTHQLNNGKEKQPNNRQAQIIITDSDDNTDANIKTSATHPFSHIGELQQEDEDNLEVVGFDYMKQSGFSCHQHKGNEEKNASDSPDTDDLLASRKPAPQARETTALLNTQPSAGKKKKKRRKTCKAGEQGDDSTDDDDIGPRSRKLCSTQKRINSDDKSKDEKLVEKQMVSPVLSPHDEEDQDEDEVWHSDSEYEALFSNATHLQISLADLQWIAEEALQGITPSSFSCGSSKQEASCASGPAEPQKLTTAEKILASLMAEDSSDDEKKKKKKSVKLMQMPAFQGAGGLDEQSETKESPCRQEEAKQKLYSGTEVNHEEMARKNRTVTKGKLIQPEDNIVSCGIEEDDTNKKQDIAASENEEGNDGDDEDSDEEEVTAPEEEDITSPEEEEENDEEEDEDSEDKEDGGEEDDDDDTAEEDDEEEEDEGKAVPPPEEISCEEEEEEEEEEEKGRVPSPSRAPVRTEELQRQDNMRRLAAIQQRQKEAEEHKKLIQGALAKLDSPAGAAGKRIVFDSDDDEEEEDEDKQRPASEAPKAKVLILDSKNVSRAAGDVGQAQQKQSVPQLFSSSEDEENSAEEKHESRFDIRPEFEGPAGQKLMELQSRFGADERFRMDARFLEQDEAKEESERQESVVDEDAALQEEKEKSLSILQSVIGSGPQSCSSKTATKAKTFRDVSALHYDPSKEEHAAFETKTIKDKESKAARKRKREEAQKLPEVSKEIYYDVSDDLKTVFGASKEDGDAEDQGLMGWDQQEGTGVEEQLLSLPPADAGAKEESSSDFKFSFFGDETNEPGSTKTAVYKVEKIEAPKVSWAQDPRFGESSSEEEEEEEEQKQEQEHATSSVICTTPVEDTCSAVVCGPRFFFHSDDNRLTEGPLSFWRTSNLEEERQKWEERRMELRKEYRKKHKLARRNLTSN